MIFFFIISSFCFFYLFVYGNNLSFDLSIINILKNTLEKVKEYFIRETENFSYFFSHLKQELEKFLKNYSSFQ